MANQLTNILNKIIVYLIMGLIFLLPLFFLPWTEEWFEFNKQYLLWLVVAMRVILWAGKMFSDGKRLVLKRTPLDIPILTFLLIIFLSSLLSIDKFSSLAGFYGRFSDAWLGLLSLVFLYFVIVNIVSDRSKLKITSLVELLFYSHGLVLTVVFLSVFGWLNKIFPNFLVLNTIGGSLNILAVYNVVMVVLLFGWLFFNCQGASGLGLLKTWLFRIILFLSLALLALINFSLAWWCLLAAGFLFLLAEFRIKKKLGEKMIWPLVLVLIVVIFLLFPSQTGKIDYYLAGQELSREISLDYKDSALIAVATLKDNLILGSGPGTFAYDFSLYRDVSFNTQEFWQLRFNKASSHILEMAGTLGILGILSYFLILSLLVYLVYIFIKRLPGKKDERGRAVTLAVALLILILLQFLYLNSTVLLFLFWLLLSFLMVLWREIGLPIFEDLKINLNKNKIIFKMLMITVFLAASGWAIIVGFETRYWLADFYARAGSEKNLIKAVNLNPYRYSYQVGLAKHYLNEIKNEIIKPANLRDDNLIEESIEKSVKWARAATVTQPNSVLCQETLGMVYRDVRLLTQGSELWAIRAFEEASKLEPTNPVLLTELGKAHLNVNMTEEAEVFFSKAIELKNDYYEAKFGLAKVQSKKNREDKALEILEELVKVYTTEEVFYEQGRLYYNQGKIEEAINNFSQIILINPNHSNALYSLSLALELQGEDEEALKYFRRVLELNPDNEEIAKRIEDLEVRSEK